MSVASGLNAMAHCVEAFWAPGATRSSSLAAGRHQRADRGRCRVVVADPAGQEGRAARCTARTWPRRRSRRRARACTTRSATCSAAATTCRTPRPMRSCCRTCWRSTRRERRRPSAGSPGRWAPMTPAGALAALAAQLGIPGGLRDIGLREEQIAEAAELVGLAVPADNPVPADELPCASSSGRHGPARRNRPAVAHPLRRINDEQAMGGHAGDPSAAARPQPGGGQAAREQAVTDEVLASFARRHRRAAGGHAGTDPAPARVRRARCG